MSKYQRWLAACCLLSGASIMLGMAAKSIFTYASLVGWFFSMFFIITAIILWFKANQRDQERCN